MKLERCSIRHLALWVILCVSPVYASSALAQSPCKADVAKFCAQIEPGKGRIARCLKQSQAQLSAACQQHMKGITAQLGETLQACEDDMQRFCAGVEVGGGRIAQCLRANSAQLSAECRTLAAQLRNR